jgi:hypothetical protein
MNRQIREDIEVNLDMEWALHYPDDNEYHEKPFSYEIEATEFKIYDRSTGDVAAVLTLVDEHSWKVDIKLIQDSWSFQDLSVAIMKAMDNYKVT